MARDQRDTQSAHLSSTLGKLLGLSDQAVRHKLRWGRLLILVPAETDREPDRPRSENAAIIQALQERIGALEQRLDRAEAERRQLIQDADAERTMMLEAVIEANKSKWPGLWPWLRRFWLGETVKSDRLEQTHQDTSAR